MKSTRALPVLCFVLLCSLVVSATPGAQSTSAKPTLKPADYDQFETVTAAAARGGLSPDGKFLAYTVGTIGGKSELRVLQIGGEVKKTIAYATGAAFTSNSLWIAYSIGVSQEEQDRLTAARQPIRRKLGILNLADNTETVIDGIDSFQFDRTGQTIAMRRAAPAPAGGGAPAASPAPAPAPGRGGAAPAPAAPLGGTVLVRDLRSGATTTFGNVSEFSWQPRDGGRLFAMIISADGRAGNGVQIFDAASSVLRVLEEAEADYSALVWRDDSSDLLVLKSKTDDKRDGPTQIVTAWSSVGSGSERKMVLDPTSVGALAVDQRIVTARRPSWLTGASGSAPMVMLGVAEWPVKPAPPEGGRGAGNAAANEKADVDVWHWSDAIVMPRQKLNVAADRRRNHPAVWHVGSNKVVVLGKSFDESLTPIPKTSLALVSEFAPYLMDRSIGRFAADWSLVDMTSGARTPLRSKLASNLSISTGGQYAIFSTGGHYHTIELATKTVRNITGAIRTSFVDTESDSTSPERPMFGIVGWTKDDEYVLLNDRYDVWKVSPAGGGGIRITDGASEQVRHRLVNVAGQFGEPFDLSRAYVSLFSPVTKKSGYAQLTADGTAPARLIWLDKSVAGLTKAEKADVYTYRVQAADDPPDIFVGGADLAAARQVTTTNAFLSNYAWTRAELVNYTVTRGKQKIPLQGVLQYPANYQPGRRYPMVVYLYEKLSDGLHNFQNPSERDYYNGTAFTQDGYFFYQPDIVFTPREPGVSVVECVTAAVNQVITMGVVDPLKIGVMGHSWGGFDAMYLSTHSKLFAAAVSGAGISNLISNYGNHHWSSGIAETDHIETGQQRMVVPLYDDLQAYIRNSAVFGISTMTTPLLLMTGDNDGTVFWHQSVELYNIARRAKKNVVMLVYNGEDHGLRQRKNQVDYHRRIHAWFDHYLKGVTAEKWITDGIPATAR